MSNISVAETLKIHGRWIEATPFVSLVAKKLKISERMAYIKIKEAVKCNEILKNTLSNRKVLYGLAEFGAEPSSKEDSSDLKFYVEQGLLTDSQINTYVAAKTLLKNSLSNSLESQIYRLLVSMFEEKLKTLKKLRMDDI